jgi:kumamolisin
MVLVLGALVASVGCVAPVPAQAASPQLASPQVASNTTSLPAGHQVVYLQLAASNPTELQRLASAHRLSGAERTRRFAAAQPSVATRTRVEQLARAAGLRVMQSNGLSVTAEGTPSRVAAFVGDRAAAARSKNAAIPASLRGLVSGISGGNAPGVRLHPMAAPLTYASPTFSDLTTRYAGVNGTPAGGQALTIATIQLSGWDDAALSHFATSNGLPDPVASGQYTPVAVAPLAAADVTVVSGGGDQEVALDQEALLATAPHANQRVYFAQNNLSGSFADAVTKVAAEAAAYHIVALSISWGSCEANWGPDMAGMHNALLAAKAAGVTVFAASGDSGKYDCYDTQTSQGAAPVVTDIGVDYPASDPLVVAVGGTSVFTTAETAWSDPQLDRPWGSGGGTSAIWQAPAWQVGASARNVPDIAANADASSGPPVYLPYPNNPSGFAWMSGGGTSIASPLMAAMFTNTLAQAGFTTGIGDIHTYLYQNPPTGSFADVTFGGDNSTSGPSSAAWAASAGYDRATGLGTPRWNILKVAYLYTPVLRYNAYTTTGSVDVSAAVSSQVTYDAYRYGVGTAPTIDPLAACPTTGTLTATPAATITSLPFGSNNIWFTAQVTVNNAPTCYLVQGTVVYDITAPTASVSTAGYSIAVPFTASTSFTLKALSVDTGGAGMLRTEYHGRYIAATAPTRSFGPYGSVGSMGTATSKVLTLGAGREYCFQVRAVDRAGNTSAWSKDFCTTTAIDDRSLTRSNWGWTQGVASGWQSGTKTSTPYSYRTLTFGTATTRVRQIGITAQRCSTCGSVKVYVGATLIGTVNTMGATKFPVLYTFPRRSAALVGQVRLVTQSARPVAIDSLLLVSH